MGEKNTRHDTDPSPGLAGVRPALDRLRTCARRFDWAVQDRVCTRAWRFDWAVQDRVCTRAWRFDWAVQDRVCTRARRFDWAVLIVLGLALVAAAPFLARPGLPRETDAELHVYRAAELGHTLRAGAFYPRWAPDFYFGYGYPIFNYYAPLTYYLANLFDLLPGVGIVGGVKAVFVLGLFVAAFGTYFLGRELFGRAAGVLAAACFTFSPYVVLIDPHARGDLAEHFAVCLLPLAFYAFHRLISGVGRRWSLLGGVLTLAAIVFSHNLLGLVAGGLLFAYWVWQVLLGPGRSRAGWGALAFVLAAGLIAFFWFPALLERGEIKLDVVGPGHFDFREHFLSIGELLAPSRPLDLGATAPRYQFNLGLAQWLLALPALCALLYAAGRRALSSHRHTHTSLLFFILAGLGLIFLMLPVSTPIWEQVPWMAYLQFPWRLLGPANLMLAVCAAGSVTWLPAGRWRDPARALLLAAILALALPVLYPPMWGPDFGPTEPADIIHWEMRTEAVGTTSTGDFVPAEAALVLMYPQGSLVDSYLEPGPVDRVNRATLPEGASVEILEHGPLHDRFLVRTPTRFVLRLFTFYFPGWRATVDGAEVEIEVAGPEGFITFWVPEGEHEVHVRFGDTPPRTAGWAISGVGLAGLIAALVLTREPPDAPIHRGSCISLIRGSPLPPPRQGVHLDEAPTDAPIHRGSCISLIRGSLPLLWLGGVLLLFAVLKSAVIDTHDDWLRCTSPPGEARAAQHELWAGFVDGGGRVELLGYDLPRRRVRSGETVPVTLYWHALTPLEVNYQSFVHLARPLHVLWGQEDHLNPGNLPTERWPLDRYVWDEYEIPILPGTPPGEYALNVGIYSMAEGYRLQRYDEVGQIAGDSVVIALVEVERPRRQPTVAELGMTREVDAAFPEGGVTLLGYAQPYEQMALPGGWPLTLFWRAERDAPAALSRDLVLLDAEGREAARLSGAPADGAYPFGAWQAGEVVRDPLVLAVPQMLDLGPADVDRASGTYRFGVAVHAEGVSSPRFVPLGSVTFTVPEG